MSTAFRQAIARAASHALVVPIVIFMLAFTYRFNTLGGALGGFDNDHFLYFVLAKQVQAGEQPLRDFQDAMHGARPSLTYELSAAAQRYLGDNLRSEAVLTAGGVALGAAGAFIAGRAIAPWPWALTTALLSVLLSPKLYGYPKVLVIAVASLLIVRGARPLTWGRVAAMSLWTAVAFLFRHDYAVYCAVGFVAMIAIAGGPRWRNRIERGVAYVVVTALLLMPSLWWIQRYSGLTEYVRNAREMSLNEYERTQIGWPAFNLGDRSPFALFESDENAEAWIYYLFLGVPVLVIGIAAWKFRSQSEPDPRLGSLVALSAMTAVLAHFLLRGNVSARFGDMGPAVAVLGAYLLFMATTRGRPSPRKILVASLAIAVLAVTVVCTWRVAGVGRELRLARLLEPQHVFARLRQVSTELAGMPRSLRESQAADRMQAADYLDRCTRPTDRVIAVGYYPEVLAFAERRFAGGRVTFVVGNYADERYLRETIAKLRSQSVPIILGGREVDYSEFGLLGDYIRAHYNDVGAVTINGDSLRVWVRRGLPATMSGPGGLPCFG